MSIEQEAAPKTRRQQSAMLGVHARRRRNPYDATVLAERREWAEGNLAAHIEKILAVAPPLTEDQKTRLAALLNGPAASA